MIQNKNGLIAVQHYNSNGWDVEVKRQNAPSVFYNFRPSHNVSMTWVAKEDLDKILAIRTRACCGKDTNRFHLATLINVNLWSYGERHKPEDATYKEI